MKESPAYQWIMEEGIEQGIERGVEDGKRETILLLGGRRFGKPTARVRRKLDAIHDAKTLDALVLRILDVDSWKDLLAALPAK